MIEYPVSAEFASPFDSNLTLDGREVTARTRKLTLSAPRSSDLHSVALLEDKEALVLPK